MSLQLSIANAWLRLFMKGRRPVAVDPAKARRRMRRVTRLMPPPPLALHHEVAPAHADHGLCPAEWLRVGRPARTVLYLHGGGYIIGSPTSHRLIACELALRTQAQVLLPDYRLAPEHPFPAAVDDALAWYRQLLEQDVSPQHLVVAGDSAGGGLAVALLVAARAAGLPMPACAVLFSPWVDLTGAGGSVQQCARSDLMLHPQWLAQAASLYLHGQDARTPLASPLYADLHGLPPLQVFASQHEVLRDDAVRLAERARSQGVDVALTVEPGMPHVWPVLTHLPEAKKTLAQVQAFIARHVPAASGRAP